MRQIILDTETTGLDPALGNRILEIGGVEIVNRQPTGKHFHRYINPERESEEGALQVHGITSEFLADKPKFREIAQEFLDYVAGAELVIHNAPFDIAFLNHELRLLDRKPMKTYCPSVVDTLKQARELHPGKRNNLDALCERYQINNAGRTLHGALLDAQLLAEVYLAMTRGQGSLMIDAAPATVASADENKREIVEIIVLRASEEELLAHEQQVAAIDKASGGKCLWKNV
jgi:DNA polymerase III subunit epsilon